MAASGDAAANAAATGPSAVTSMSNEEAKKFLSEDQEDSAVGSQETVDGVETTLGSNDLEYTFIN